MNSDRGTTFAGLIAAVGVFLMSWFGIELPSWLGSETVVGIIGSALAAIVGLLGWKANKAPKS